jgi:hypothetical protein
MAMASLMSDAQRAGGKRLPLMRQGRLMIQAMPKATRVGEFIAMWSIAKHKGESTSVESLAEYWGEPPRTMYRRLAEFREVWGAGGFDTPDAIADALIADYRARRERLNAGSLARLLSTEVALTSSVIPAGVTP